MGLQGTRVNGAIGGFGLEYRVVHTLADEKLLVSAKRIWRQSAACYVWALRWGGVNYTSQNVAKGHALLRAPSFVVSQTWATRLGNE